MNCEYKNWAKRDQMAPGKRIQSSTVFEKVYGGTTDRIFRPLPLTRFNATRLHELRIQYNCSTADCHEVQPWSW